MVMMIPSGESFKIPKFLLGALFAAVLAYLYVHFLFSGSGEPEDPDSIVPMLSMYCTVGALFFGAAASFLAEQSGFAAKFRAVIFRR